MGWNYKDVLPPEPDSALPVAKPVAAPSPKLSSQDIERVRNASPEQQTAIAELLAQHLDPQLLVHKVKDVLGPGSDAMVATATGLGMNNQLGLVAQQANEGRSTVSDHDIQLLQQTVETRVKQMIAHGARDQEIQQAVGQIVSHPELAGLAQQMAQQQLDAEKFNLFNTRDAAGKSDSSTIAVAAGVAVAAIVSSAAAAPEYDLPAARMPYLDMGPTTAAIAAQANGFVPQTGIGTAQRSSDLGRAG